MNFEIMKKLALKFIEKIQQIGIRVETTKDASDPYFTELISVSTINSRGQRACVAFKICKRYTEIEIIRTSNPNATLALKSILKQITDITIK